MESSIVELQVKVTYLENLVATLNEVVTRQADDLAGLTKRLAQVESQLAEGDTSEPAEEALPPHY